MRPLRILALVLCVISAAALLLCLCTDGGDHWLLPLALGCAVAANLSDRRAEQQSQRGESHE